MSEKRFTNVGGVEEFVHLIFDNETARTLSVKQTVQKLNEQQATIRKLQDLCGESDGENAKLRIENKRLQEENEQLKEEIESLKQKEDALNKIWRVYLKVQGVR